MARLTPVSGASGAQTASADELAAQATEQWRHDVQVGALTAASTLDKWFTQTSWSQGQASRVLNRYLDGISGRKVSAPTFSRFRREPVHVVHATLGVLMTMTHVYGHTLTDLAQRIDGEIERARFGRNRTARTVAEARREKIQEVADLLPHLTDSQLHDIGRYMATLAQENLQVRADLVEQGTPLDAEVPGLEAEAAGRSAQAELATWADRQRATTRRSRTATERPS